ncbi:MAG: BLUF domain-containing protein [Gammaproteobacteria bacterium]
MNSLIQCIYSSVATPGFEEHQIPGLLERARAANAALDVTGMLLYIEGSFFQILEGDPDVVDAVFLKIKADPRHSRVTTIVREPIFERSFGEWTMGFAVVGRKEACELIGENDFFASASCVAEMTAGRAKKLLSAFRMGRWRTEYTGRHPIRGRVA